MIELLKVSVSKHASFEADFARDLPPVKANPAQLRQLVMNLVINSSEALGEKPGLIRVSTSQVTDGRFVKLEVSDTGCGMEPADQARIFDPFYTTKAAGRGLGLPVVQGIVRGLGGVINVESAPGLGTTFRILLPCAAGTAASDSVGGASAAREELRPAVGTVLIVEDEESLLRPVSKMLRRANFAVLEVSDGSAALDTLRSHGDGLDLMFLDVTLPGMPSPEILREAMRIRPGLKVILTSAYDEQKVEALFTGLAFECFIRKPYRIAEVVEILRQKIGSS
jgi:CheY-like chemotaxis protein